MLVRNRVVEAVLDVVFAGPDHLDRRTAHVAGQDRGFECEVALRLAAETAAEQRDIHRDGRLGHAEQAGDITARTAGALHAGPDLRLAAGNLGDRRGRFHGGVVAVGDVVLALDDLRGALECGIHVAFVPLDLAGLAGGGSHLLLELAGVVVLVGTVFPLHCKGFTTTQGSPGVVRHDGDAAEGSKLAGSGRRGDRDDLDHAGHLHGGVGVPLGRLATDHGRTRDHGVLHAVDTDVLRVVGLACRDVGQIDDRDVALADVAELGRLLEGNALERRRGQRRGGSGEFAVADLLAAGRVHHEVILRTHFGVGHGPGDGRGLLEHLAHGGTAGAHRLHEVADAAGTVGVLVAVLLLVARGLNDLDLGPVGFHFVGHDHRQARAGAGTHFGTVRHDRDGAIRRDRHEDVRIPDGAAGHAARAGVVEFLFRQRITREDLCGENQTAGRNHALQHVPAADVLDLEIVVFHLKPPSRRLSLPQKSADSNRNGRCCPPSWTGFPRRRDEPFRSAGRRPA